MPKSKRNKLVTLSTTIKKGQAGKNTLIEQIRSYCDKDFKFVYVFDIRNMRTSKLKEVRDEWNGSRFFLGKNKVMQVALGRSTEEEYKPRLHLVSDCLKGHCGLFFTNEPQDKVFRFFEEYSEPDFARSGSKATEDVTIPAGPTHFAGAMEPYLRTFLGVPTQLKNGVVSLIKDHVVCKTDDTLTPEQCKLLELLQNKMSCFEFSIKCVWSDGKFKKFAITKGSDDSMKTDAEKGEDDDDE